MLLAGGLFREMSIDMWIRGTVRLFGVALLGVEISIIASASASAAATAPGKEAEKQTPPITRIYAVDGIIHPARWILEVTPTKADLKRALPRQAALRVSHQRATTWLRDAGLRWTSSGNCTNRYIQTCTSLEAVRTETIAKVIQLKQDSGCRIMVTGGTETGHMPGRFSHAHGYKLDIALSRCINEHITSNHPRAGARSDGTPLYRSQDGTIFAKEPSHWDILFR